MANKTVTVKSGNTLSGIAAANNTTVAKIVAANPTITNPSLIKPGQKITIPTASTPAASSTAGAKIIPTTSANTTAFVGPIPVGTTRTSTGYVPTTTPTVTTATTTSTIKTVAGKVTNPDGTVTITYSDGTSETVGTPKTNKTVVNTFQNPDGTVTIVYSDGTSEITGTPTSPTTTNTGISASDMQNMINALNASWQAKFDALTTQQKDANRAATTTALQDFTANLRLAGLDSLADTVNEMILQDKTAAQIKIDLVSTPAYKNRFPGMEALAKAGKAVNEATYISMERGMINVLKAYGLDDKVLGTTAKLGEVIANQVSVTEYENRVSLAADHVKKNPDVLAALNEYYGVDTAGAISYLLDPKLGMDIVKKQVRSAEIGAAAEMYNFSEFGGKPGAINAESYINVAGNMDLNALKESFGKARTLADTQARMAGIEGEKYDELQAVATQLGNDQQRLLESQRRALREQARFAGQSGVSSASLKTASTI